MTIFGALLIASLMMTSCTGGEYDCIKYRAKDNSFSKTYGSNVYYDIILGNKVNSSAISAVLADEEGYNVFGKLFGGATGLYTIVDGSYKIESGVVIIQWQNSGVLNDLPTKLKIDKDGFNSERINISANSLKDEEHNMNYLLHDKWDVK